MRRRKCSITRSHRVQVTGAYLLVVLIWSTTPLAIHWSNSSLSFVAAITLRMALALPLCFLLMKIQREPLIRDKRDWLAYAAGALGLFPNMLLVYWAAQFISSGLMSVMFGLYPFCVGVFSLLILRVNPFTPAKVMALLLAVLGLWILHRDQLAAGSNAAWGLAAMILVCALWGFSSVAVKKLATEVSPLRMGTGSLLLSLPFFLLVWFWLDGELPLDIQQKSLFAVIYLVLAGSLLGHVLWFYVLRACSVTSVSLITLITPVMALTWGLLFAGEVPSRQTLLGAALILLALLLYQGIFVRLLRILRASAKFLAVPSGEKN
jgi:probable blue pigment (indigoidine) exporter